MTQAIGPLTRFGAFWNVIKDPRTPKWGKYGLVVLALVYLISPIDIIPDVFVGAGWIDDLIVVPTLLWLITRIAPKFVRREALEKALRGTRARPA